MVKTSWSPPYRYGGHLRGRAYWYGSRCGYGSGLFYHVSFYRSQSWAGRSSASLSRSFRPESCDDRSHKSRLKDGSWRVGVWSYLYNFSFSFGLCLSGQSAGFRSRYGHRGGHYSGRPRSLSRWRSLMSRNGSYYRSDKSFSTTVAAHLKYRHGGYDRNIMSF